MWAFIFCSFEERFFQSYNIVILKYTATLQGDSKEINQCWLKRHFALRFKKKYTEKYFKNTKFTMVRYLTILILILYILVEFDSSKYFTGIDLTIFSCNYYSEKVT